MTSEFDGTHRADIPQTIECVECGGAAHLSSFEPDEGFEPGDVVAYVCEDCGHRHDIELGDEA